jgi:sialate O-acetylesterase
MKKVLLFVIVTLGAVLVPGRLSSKVVLEPIFTDNMVLQRNATVSIWGAATPLSRVSVRPSWTAGTYQAPVAENGKWSVRFPTPDAGGPYSIVFSDGEAVTLNNVLIGEVWICSGQSNMEMPMGATWAKDDRIGVDGFKEELAALDKVPGLRLLNLKKVTSHVPLESASVTLGGWNVCTEESVTPFSATAYFFGKYLYETLGVPVGLIETCWGGTIAEAWTSEASLRQMHDFDSSLAILDVLPEKIKNWETDHLNAIARWKESVNAGDPSWMNGKKNWAGTKVIEADWGEMENPCKMQKVLGETFNGVVWFRKTVEIPRSWAGKDLTLRLSTIDDEDWTFFNDTQVGNIDGYLTEREYTVPGSKVKAGKAVLSVRVADYQGTGGLWGKPEDMYLQVKGDPFSRIPLAGTWKYKVSVPKDQTPELPAQVHPGPNFPTLLYNAMIHPIVGYGIRGAIWYQGESNAGRAAQYRELLPLMIRDWRKAWGYSFPFYIVQIANFMAPQTGPEESSWAFLRDAQKETATRLEHSGLAVTIDIGEADDIHPRNKYDVGKRLALQALAKTYGKDVVCDGPLYRSYLVKGREIEVSFCSAEGLTTSDGKAPAGFWIAGSDHLFHPADARIEGAKVIVSSPEVEFPVAVRYAWANNPFCNLVNAAGLPASPFRTDDWLQKND